MNKRYGFAAVTSLTVILGIATPAAATPERIVCKSINARQTATFLLPEQCTGSPIGLCTEGRIHNGPLRGKTLFTALELVPGAGFMAPPYPVAAYHGQIEIVTRHGTIVTRNTGVFDPVPAPDGDGTFAQFDRIVETTGRFEGATGTLFFTGVGNEDGTGFESHVTGEICVPMQPRRGDSD